MRQRSKAFSFGEGGTAQAVTEEAKNLSRFRLRSTTLPKGEGLVPHPALRATFSTRHTLRAPQGKVFSLPYNT